MGSKETQYITTQKRPPNRTSFSLDQLLVGTDAAAALTRGGLR